MRRWPNCGGSTTNFFVPSEALLRNLQKAIAWSHERPTPNWCKPYDPMLETGCAYWTEGPPPESVCRACPVHHVFCAGCSLVATCRVAVYPKYFPEVSRFLARFNFARGMQQPVWGTRWQDIPVKEWLMILTAMGTGNEMERKRQDNLARKMRGRF